MRKSLLDRFPVLNWFTLQFTWDVWEGSSCLQYPSRHTLETCWRQDCVQLWRLFSIFWYNTRVSNAKAPCYTYDQLPKMREQGSKAVSHWNILVFAKQSKSLLVNFVRKRERTSSFTSFSSSYLESIEFPWEHFYNPFFRCKTWQVPYDHWFAAQSYNFH